MKKILTALFCSLEVLLAIVFCLFFFAEKNTWFYSLLLVLIGVSSVVGVALLFVKKK